MSMAFSFDPALFDDLFSTDASADHVPTSPQAIVARAIDGAVGGASVLPAAETANLAIADATGTSPMGSETPALSVPVEGTVSFAGPAITAAIGAIVTAIPALSLSALIAHAQASVSQQNCGPIDFLFLQDLSGSFTDDLPILQAQIANVIATVNSIDSTANFGVASFIDKPTNGFGSSGDYVYRTDLAMTTDSDAVIGMMNALYTLSGADTPEAQLEALLQVALRAGELGWRADSEKIVMLSTDSDYHVAGDFASAGPNNGDAVLDGTPAGTGEDYPEIYQVASELVASGIFPVFAVTAAQIPIYEDLVLQLGTGAVIELTSNSDNFSDAVRLAIALNCGDVTHEGTEGNDDITGTENEDGIYGKGGDDTINGGKGHDVCDGGSGNDDIKGGKGSDDIHGGTGDDFLRGNGGKDTVSGDIGNDTIKGGGGNDVFIIKPGDGFDVIKDFAIGADLLDLSSFKQFEGVDAVNNASDGTNGLILTMPDGTQVTLSGVLKADFSLTDVIVNTETDAPTAVADADNVISGDTLVLDVLSNDFDVNGDAVTLTAVGTASHGTVALAGGGQVSYVATGGFVGTDTFTYTISDGVKTATGTVTVTVLPDLIGDDSANVLIGTDAAELFEGFGGNDTINAMGGNDTIDGGTGNDSIDGGLGDDVINSGDGDDYIYGGSAGEDEFGDVIDAGAGNDTVLGGGAADTITGGDGKDDIDGGTGDDVIIAGNGSDLIAGGTENDEIDAGNGNDTIDGGSGGDQIEAGAGDDLITGGTGPDEFLFRLAEGQDLTGDDIITDFDIAEDLLVLDLDGNVGWTVTDSTDGALLSADTGASILVLGVLADDLSGAITT